MDDFEELNVDQLEENGKILAVTGDEDKQNGCPEGRVINQENQGLAFRAKIIHTIWLSCAMAAIGACIAIRGPTLLDLQRNTHSDLTQVTAAVITGMSVGWLLGSLIGGILFDKFNKQLLLASTGILGGLVMIATPWCTNIVLLGSLFALGGVFISAYDTAGMALCVNLWGINSGPYLQALDCCFAFGSFSTPLIVEAFLKLSTTEQSPSSTAESFPRISEIPRTFSYSENILTPVNDTSAVKISGDGNDTGLQNSGTGFQDYTASTLVPVSLSLPYNSSSQIPHSSTHFQYAYISVGIISLITGLPFVINLVKRRTYFRATPKIQRSTLEKDIKEERIFKYQIMTLVAIFSCFYNGIEETVTGLLKAFAVKHLKWTESTGNILMSVFWGTYTVFRGISIIIAKYLHPGHILLMDLSLLMAACLGLLLVNFHDAILWICAGLIGIAISSVFATRIAWTDRYIKVSGKLLGFMFVFEGIGSMAIPPLVAVLIENNGPMWYVYILLMLTTCTLGLMIGMHIRATRRGKRFSAVDLSVPKSDSLETEIPEEMQQCVTVRPGGTEL